MPDGTRHKLNAFVMTLGYSRAMFCDIATDQKLPAFLRMHEAAFEYLGGVPQEILYDNTKTVVLKTLTEGVDGRGEVKLNPAFADFARYWGFTPRLCRPYRPQTKGKVESGIGYLRKNFLCGRDATGLDDLRQQMRVWTADGRQCARYMARPIAWWRKPGKKRSRACTPWQTAAPIRWWWSSVRRVTRDAYVCYQSNRYSVPWQHAGKEVLVREVGEQIEILRERQTLLAAHTRCSGRHQTVTVVGPPCGHSHHRAQRRQSAPVADGGRARSGSALACGV